MTAGRFVDASSLVPTVLDSTRRAELAARAAFIVSMRWFETTIVVAFDDAQAAELYAHRYARFAATGPAALSAFAVRDGDATYYWIEGGPAFVCEQTLRSTPLQFLADIAVRDAYFGSSRYSSFHAAALSDGTVAAAITAISEGGKTTTAIACARRGMHLYSDEWCILDGIRVRPFPRRLNVRRGGSELLLSERVPGDDRLYRQLREHAGGDWESVDPADIRDGWTPPEPRPLRAIFFIAGRGAEADARPLSLERAMRALLEAPLRSRRRGMDRIVEARAVLRVAMPFALTLGSPDRTARLIGTICTSLGAADRPQDPAQGHSWAPYGDAGLRENRA